MPPYLAQFPMMIALKVALDAAVPVFSSVSVSRPEIRVDRHGTAAFRAVERDVPPFTGIFIINSNVALVDHVEGGVPLGLCENTILNRTRTGVATIG